MSEFEDDAFTKLCTQHVWEPHDKSPKPRERRRNKEQTMKKTYEYNPRGTRKFHVQFEVSLEQCKALDALNLPHGFIRIVFSAITDEFTRMMATDEGKIVFGALATGSISLREAIELASIRKEKKDER